MKKIKEIFIKYKTQFIVAAFVALGILTYILFLNLNNMQKKYEMAMENKYDMAFYQLIDNVQEVEIYLAKSSISNSPESGTENLNYIWREANLALNHLAMLPVSTAEMENTSKFLNQISSYCFTLSKKTSQGELLSQEDLDNLYKLHNYAIDFENALNQLSVELGEKKNRWKELNKSLDVTRNMGNIPDKSFENLEQNFHEYAGLIYDGAFSEHLINPKRLGLTGDDIDENKAKEIATNIIEGNNIQEIQYNGFHENGNIPSYEFYIKNKNGEEIWIAISKKGGHLVYMNCNREVQNENVKQEDIDKISDEYLKKLGYNDMKKTYFTIESGIETINYAYTQDDVTVYPDLIKVKLALDNGEVLGVETTGYLNSHTNRELKKAVISKEEAREKINKNLIIESERLVIIPTKYQTELMCWEFRGKVDEREFLVYINVENGKEEDILVVINSNQGTHTM